MTPEMRQRVGELFDQALSVSAGQRATFMAEACRDEPTEVRLAVESLLAHFDSAVAAGFLKEPSAGMVGNADTVPGGESAREEMPHAPPGYEILCELGRGGMGVVYKARQTSLNRLVALKMILPGARAYPEFLARFRTEAEAAARFQHTSLVQIYEVGQHQGQAYCALEYVEGGSLANKLAGTLLPAHAAAALGETLARAMHYAHQRGIVHRDLKPGNILLTADGVPKIADFGLAKRLDEDQGLTETGRGMGTPSYMAPEQAEGKKDVGPAADIYALGAVVYEMLAGRPPFVGVTRDDILEQVKNHEPPPFSRLHVRVPRNLETICRKCLHKEPAQRYVNAGELADDLRRFQAGEPIRARPVGPLERLGRWCRRKPVVASLLAALLLVFVGGVAGVTWQWIRAERGWAKAENEFRDHHHSVAEFYKLATEDDLLFQPAFQPVAKKWREAALAYFRGFLEQRGEDPRLRAEVADAHFRIAQMTDALESRLEALAAYEQAALQLEKLCAENPTDGKSQFLLAYTYQNRGILLGEIKDRQKALESLGQAQKLFQGLVESNPDDREAQHGLASTLLSRSKVQMRSGQFLEALPPTRQAVGILEKLTDSQRESIPFRYELSNGYSQLGELCRLLKQPKALESYQKAQKLLVDLARSNPNRPDFQGGLARVQHSMGHFYLGTGQGMKALTSLHEAMKTQEKLTHSYPAFTDFQRDLAESYVILGDLRDDLELTQKARQIAARLVQEHPEQIDYQTLLARGCYHTARLQQKKDPQSAIQAFEQAKNLLEPLDVRDAFHLEILFASYMEFLGMVGERSSLDATLSLLGKAQAALTRLLSIDPSNPKYLGASSRTFFLQGKAYERHGRSEDALTAYQGAIEPAWAAFNLSRPGSDQQNRHRKNLSECLVALAKAQRDRHRPAEAVAACLKRKELWPRDADELCRVARHIALCIPLVGQGQAELSTDQQAERDRYAVQAVAVLAQALACGYQNIQQLETTPELQPLRSREDFQKLLAKLKEKRSKSRTDS